MFENIGNTIKIMAKVFWWIGTITLVGIIIIWPMAFILYGFGELVENSTKTAKDTNNTLRLNVLKSQTTENSKTMAHKEKIINSVIKEIDEKEYQEELSKEKEYQEKLLKNPDFDPENIASADECPACFHKITNTDTACTYCGHKLK